MIPGFPIDDAVRCLGHIHPRLTPAAWHALAEADAVISVERSLALPLRAARIVILGGVGYPHTLDLLARGAWQRLVVPSPLVASRARERAGGKGRVVVVPNGIDIDLFRPDGSAAVPPRTLRLLLAARPVADKGLPAALRLVRALRRGGLSVVLTCFDQPDGLDGSGLLPTLGARDRALVEVLPWHDHADMPQLYASAALTLCLSTTEEGFGLAAVESLACGTPVLATPTGFLPSLVPPAHGLHFVDPHVPVEAWTEQALVALRSGTEVLQGRRFVQRHYPLHAMVDRFATTIAEALDEHGDHYELDGSHPMVETWNA